MKKNIFFIMILSFLLLIGCLKKNENDFSENIFLDTKIETNQTMEEYKIPDRAQIENEVILALNNNSAARKSPLNQEYYFSLSKEVLTQNGNNGTIEIQFNYISNYETENEQIYSGKIYLLLELVIQDSVNKWICSDTQVSFENVQYGKISGIISQYDGNWDLKIFGKNNTELTRFAKVESNGSFLIDKVLFNNYDINITGTDIVEKVISSISVNSEDTYEIGSISIETSNKADYAIISGSIFFDYDRQMPAENVCVELRDSQNTIESFYTNASGKYSFNNIAEGNYFLKAYIQENQNDTIEIFADNSNYGSHIIEDIILPNNLPVITSITPSEEIITADIFTAEVFTINVEDIDNDNILYTWEKSGGTFETVNDNSCSWSIDSAGTYWVKVCCTDNKGGYLEYTWNIECVPGSSVTTLNDGLICGYHLSGNVSDFSGNNNDGTAANSTICEDKNINPDSAFKYYNIISPVRIHIDEGAISFWMYSENDVDDYDYSPHYIVQTKAPRQPGFHFGIHNGNWVVVGNQISGYPIYSSNTFASHNMLPDNWYHITISWSANENNFKIYINGTFQAETGEWNTAPCMSVADLYYYLRLNRRMDEIRVYDRPLSLQEVTALYYRYEFDN